MIAELLRLDWDGDEIMMLVTSQVERDKRVVACKKEPETMAWLQEMPTNAVFWDVGANVGSYTLIACSRGIRTCAFEASLPNAERLRENLKINGLAADVITDPLWESEVMIPWTYSSEEPGAALHSVKEGGRLRPAYPADSYLDTLPPPTHMKIDVDGCEEAILRGATEALRGVESLLIEQDDSEPSHALIPGFLAVRGLTRRSAHRHGDTSISNVIYAR